MIAGVCGGLGRYFKVDPVLFRIAFAASLLLGGLGGLLYLGAWLFVPEEGSPAQPSTPPRERSGALTALAIVALVVVAGPLLLAPVLVVLGAGLFAGLLILPLALLALVGFLVWWLVSGERPAGSTRDVLIGVALGAGLLALSGVIAIAGAWAAAVGGGAIVAGLVIAAGVMLVIGAFTGGLRWLILPALSLAIPVALVAAADIDLDGGIGERDYRPASAAQIRDRYELAWGSLTVDLRNTRLPNGPTDVTLDVGVGRGRGRGARERVRREPRRRGRRHGADLRPRERGHRRELGGHSARGTRRAGRGRARRHGDGRAARCGTPTPTSPSTTPT